MPPVQDAVIAFSAVFPKHRVVPQSAATDLWVLLTFVREKFSTTDCGHRQKQKYIVKIYVIFN